MMDIYSQLCQQLQGCRGRDQAKTLAVLADAIGCSRREVEQCIEHNLGEFPWPIVAGANGMFIPVDADDLNAYIHQLHSRHRRMQLREATVRRKARQAGWPEVAGKFIERPNYKQQELFV